MRPTRRFWTAAVAGLFLLLIGVLVEQPVFFLGALGIAGYLIARQLLFLHFVSRVTRELSIRQTVEPTHPRTEEPAELSVEAALGDSALEMSGRSGIRIRARLPIGLRGDFEERGDRGDDSDRSSSITLGVERDTASFSLPLAASIAGEYEISSPEVLLRSPGGLFEERVALGNSPILTALPRTPQNVHLGQGGDRVATGFGEHRTGRIGPGIEPAELREYLPGDPASRIDWKSTARLNEPHVLEFETETDRTTVLLLDHRASMATGLEGERKLDYARQVALAFVDLAEEYNDPIGFYGVGDAGVTARFTPTTTPGRYGVLREELYSLTPTEGDVSSDGAHGSLASVRRKASKLEGNRNPYARTLHPFYAEQDPYIAKLAKDPLYRVSKAEIARLEGQTWTVLFTDDTHRREVRETVKLLRRGDSNVYVCLTPATLYAQPGLTDLDAAFAAYSEFESFRRDLDGLERVTALELAPGDRLNTVLSAGAMSRVEGGVRR